MCVCRGFCHLPPKKIAEASGGRSVRCFVSPWGHGGCDTEDAEACLPSVIMCDECGVFFEPLSLSP